LSVGEQAQQHRPRGTGKRSNLPERTSRPRRGAPVPGSVRGDNAEESQVDGGELRSRSSRAFALTGTPRYIETPTDFASPDRGSERRPRPAIRILLLEVRQVREP